MVPSHQNTPRRAEQFRLVKFFAWASFIVLIIFSFPFSVVISEKAKETLLKSYEKSAMTVGENLNHQVFQNFVIPVINHFGKIKLSDEEQYQLMDRIVRNTIHGFNVELVNIYSIGQGVIAYSTNPQLIGVKAQETEGYQRAVKGGSSSGLLSPSPDLWGMDIELIGRDRKLRTYVPLRGSSPFTVSETYVAGVFELTQDLTSEYESIIKFQYLIFGLCILIMGLIFLALLLVVHKAEGMIEQRAQEQQGSRNSFIRQKDWLCLEKWWPGSPMRSRILSGLYGTAELLASMPGANDTQKAQRYHRRIDPAEPDRNEFLDFARPQTLIYRSVT
jgi:hypothetical protein